MAVTKSRPLTTSDGLWSQSARELDEDGMSFVHQSVQLPAALSKRDHDVSLESGRDPADGPDRQGIEVPALLT